MKESFNKIDGRFGGSPGPAFKMPAGTVKTDYSTAKIYRLVATGTTDCYIGSTCGKLEQRLWHHTHSATHPETQKQTAACKLYEGGRTVAIELLELFPCTSKAELNARERHWIENTPTAINKNKPGRTHKERIESYGEKWTEYMATYRATRIECECGASISKAEKARHSRSKKHLDYLASNAVIIAKE